jgi:medium-chain acyl-[acyl-carrier-protein] hydrolase
MTTSDRWFAPTSGGGGGVPVFCLPYAGGSAAMYRVWTTDPRLGFAAEAVQLPGRASRMLEPPFHELEPLVGALADALAPRTTQPYALFGHSMGALIGFELAREVRRRGLPGPRRLFVSAREAPQLPTTSRRISRLPDAEFLDEVRRLGSTPDEFFADPELVAVILPTLRADFELCDRYAYAPQEPLSCPISALGGTDDGSVSPTSLQAWRLQTRADFRVHLLPGGHFYLLESAAAVARIIAGDLAAACPVEAVSPVTQNGVSSGSST